MSKEMEAGIALFTGAVLLFAIGIIAIIFEKRYPKEGPFPTPVAFGGGLILLAGGIMLYFY